jgi:hypothetical protein
MTLERVTSQHLAPLSWGSATLPEALRLRIVRSISIHAEHC